MHALIAFLRITMKKRENLLSEKQQKFTETMGVLVLLKFQVNSQKLRSPGATEFCLWIGHCIVKVWKSTEDKLHNIWRSVKF